MEIFVIGIDVALLASGVLAAYYAKQVGGGIGHKSLQFMVVGFLLLGVAHIFETVSLAFLPMLNQETVELSHRLLVLAATILILIGYARLAKFARS